MGVGCQWCATTEDGERILEEPYCSAIDQCYGGVRGRQLKGECQFITLSCVLGRMIFSLYFSFENTSIIGLIL